MNQVTTRGIVLSRTDFGEADRILTLLTPDYGKLRLIAKGVRRVKSKLAGGIELFSVSDITFIQGRGDIGTLVSTRLCKHYGNIVKDIERTMLGYELIKQLARATEERPESEFFDLLELTFVALNDSVPSLDLIRVWFSAQLLRIGGHTPNLQTGTNGEKLTPDVSYEFDFENMAFAANSRGNFHVDDVKFLRLLFGGNQPMVLAKVVGNTARVEAIRPLVEFMRQQYIQ